MKAILKLDGWEKEVDLAEYFVDRGMFEMIITPPLDLRVKPKDKVVEPYGVRVAFHYIGKRRSGMPIFEYR